MAAVTVSFDGVRLSGAESNVDGGSWDKWDSSQNPQDEPDLVYQNTQSLSVKVGATSADGIEFFAFTGGTVDFEGNNRVWLLKIIVTNTGALDVQGATGLILYCGSGTTTDRFLHYWHGNDTYPIAGGWVFGLWDPAIAAYHDASEGTPDLSAVDYVAMSAEFSASSKSENFAIDAIDYFDVGDGLTLIGGDGASADGVFDDFVIADEGTPTTGRWAVVRTVNGILYVQGVLTVGTATETDFTDETGGTMVFPDGPFGPGTVGVDVGLQNASSVFSCNGWSFVGRGSVTDADSRPDYDFIGTSGAGSYTSCAFRNFRNWTLTSAGSLIDCILSEGLLITQNGGTLDGCILSGATTADGGHYVLADDPGLISDCDFTFSDGHAVRCDTVGTYDWVGNTDTGYTGTRGTNLVSSSGSNDAMFYNNSGGLITLNVDATGQSPSVRNGAGATTQVNQTVTLTATVVDELGAAVPYATVSIQDQADDSEVSAGIANNLGVYTDSTFNYTVDLAVNVVARKSSPGDSRYKVVSSPQTITSTGLNAGIGLIADPNAGLIPMVGVLKHGVQSENVNDAIVVANLDVPAGTSRKLVVAVQYWASGSDLTVSAATYDGNAMTSINSLAVGAFNEIFLYRHDIPDGDDGVKVISFTLSAAVNIKAIAFAVLDDVATGAQESADTDSGSAVTGNPSLALNNTTADSFSVGFGIGDDLDSPTATGDATNRVRRSDVVRDAALQSVTILVADRATSGAHNIGADFGANTKTWVYAGASFAKN